MVHLRSTYILDPVSLKRRQAAIPALQRVSLFRTTLSVCRRVCCNVIECLEAVARFDADQV